ncbi:MAG: HAD-IIA family hydrolase [Actinomycetaceae bacterium]|nr:HAD-IIA family hydrolase [Actinomycetaceae bacterium]
MTERDNSGPKWRDRKTTQSGHRNSNWNNSRDNRSGGRWGDRGGGRNWSGGDRGERRWNDRGGRGDRGRAWDWDNRDDRRWNNSRDDRGRAWEDRGGGRNWSGGDRGRGNRGNGRDWGDRDNRGREDRRNSDRNFRDRKQGAGTGGKFAGRKEYAERRPREDEDQKQYRDFRTEKKWKNRKQEPELPAAVKADSLDPVAAKQLASLHPDNADTVARHLVMAGSLLDLDPQAAYEHAQAAVNRAGRIGVVREAAALAAYALEKYPEALREVRAARRLTGEHQLRAIEADCERALGKPEKALEIIGETSTAKMSIAEQAELALVASGARADMGQSDAGLIVIEDFMATRKIEDDETLARLLTVKADRLSELGRDEEAAEVTASIPALPEPLTIVDFDEVIESEMEHVRSDLHGCRKPLQEVFGVALIDLDGVTYMGTKPIAHAAEGLRLAQEAGMDTVFVTNNASRLPAVVKDKLATFDIAADEKKIMTSAIDGVAILKEKLPPGARVLVIGSAGLEQLVTEAGFEATRTADPSPAAVIQGYDASVDWAALSEAAYAIADGALYVATNLDASLPTERGFSIGNGSLVAAVVNATGKQPVAGGKPTPGIYRRATELTEAEKPLCIGDRLDTDIRGGKAAGLPCLHVLTGVSDAKAVALAHREERPDFLGLDLRALQERAPGPVRTAEENWVCGTSREFRVERGHILVNDEAITTDEITLKLDDYRALVAAVWEARDNRDRVFVPIINVIENPVLSEDEATEEITGGFPGSQPTEEAGEPVVNTEDEPAPESEDKPLPAADPVPAKTEGEAEKADTQQDVPEPEEAAAAQRDSATDAGTAELGEGAEVTRENE